MSNIKDSVWTQIISLHDQGLNLIPVRDKDDEHGLAKTPYAKWTVYRTERLIIGELWNRMDIHKTNAIAVVCGKISGNICVIDIDTKHKVGIDATILKDLQSLYPDLYPRLRIDKTPSGGYHILFRVPIDTACPPTQNLAIRQSTDTELIDTPKRKTRCFIEIKGEGGLCQMPPSPGYSTTQNVPIPTLTPSESASIINLMRGYTEVVELAPVYKPTKSDNDYYDENPFDHFNASEAAEMVLIDAGWKLKKQNQQFAWFTHPESKSGGIHASFNRVKRVYYIFTSNSEFDSAKGYMPATALSILNHGGDRKKTYTHLVQSGFGKIKPWKEKIIAKKAATSNKPLPPNVSDSAIAMHAAISQQLQQDHPYGIFWIDDVEKGVIIDRHAFYHVASSLGFMLYKKSLIRVIDKIIHDQEERDFFDCLKQYVKEQDEDTYKKIMNAYEPFIEHHGKFTITRLPILSSDKILQDGKRECYKFYLDTVVYITKSDITTHSYENIKKLIWAKSIYQRNYTPSDTGVYIDFLKKAIGITDFLLQVIGYLSHEYKDEASSFIIALPEQCENPEDGGGAGKNIFCKLFENITTFSSRSGEQISYDVRLLQSWNGEKIYCISDPPKDFRWSFLKDISSNDAVLKKLFKDEVVVKSADMPKFIVPTNFGVDIKDGPLRRRIKQVEFTDFFTKTGGVDAHYGSYFPIDWTEQDWSGYDYIMTLGIKKWIANNLKITNIALSSTGWSKQFSQNYGPYITGFIKDYWSLFTSTGFVTNDQFKNYKDTYISENDINTRYRPSAHKINEALDDWSLHYGYTHNKDARDRKQIGEPRGHSFLLIDPPF